MQKVSDKIAELLASKGIFQKDFAVEIGYDYRHLNRKLSLKSAWSAKKIDAASRFLGVTPEFLRDESRPYFQGQPIPPDAILQPPAQAEVSDGDAIAALVKLAQEQMRHRKEVNSRIEPPTGASEAVVGILTGILQEMKAMRADVNRLLESAAMPGGEHDPD